MIRLFRFIVISLGLHCGGALVASLFFHFPPSPLAGGEERIQVVLSGGTPSPWPSEGGSTSGGRGNKTSGPLQAGREGVLNPTGSGPEGTDPLLAKIRTQIEKNRYYPYLAQKMGKSGKVGVRFQINGEGGLSQLVVEQSSGQTMFDEAALKTVQKGVPYPLYKEPIFVWLNYE
ncbi:MAG: energy transducer TonB [Deltaproteobacteria bacterium]|nr:energy transducer TonB [Deltaproteobacteria bacterium]